MNVRGLLAAAGLLILLAGGIYWSNKTKKDEEAKPPAETSPKITNIPEADIRQIEIRRRGGELTTVVRDAGGNWKVTTPTEYGVDKEAMNGFVSAAASLASEKVLEEKNADWASFGLLSPAIEVVVTKKDGKALKVLVGDEVPAGSSVYARLDGDARLFTIASWSKTSLDKKAADLRDKRLLTFDSDKITRIELTAKKSTTAFAKNNNNEWAIVAPSPLRADGWAVDELLRKLKDAKIDPMQTEADAKSAAAGFAGAPVVAVAKVIDQNGAQTLEVRKAKDGKYFAKSSAVAGTHTATAELGDGLDKATADFRNKKVFDFGFNEPSKIDYKDDKRSLALAKSGEKWNNGGKAMDSVSVQSFIDKLRDMSAVTFGDKGFTAPSIELTIVSNDGKRTEKVAIAAEGNRWWARRDGDPALYELDSRLVEELKKSASEVKEPAPAPAAKK